MENDPGTNWISPDLKSFIASHDLASCNFEGSIKTDSSRIRKAGSYLEQCQESVTRALEAGFGVMSLANNHIMDYGSEGIRATLEAFRGKAICIGAGLDAKEAYAPVFLEVKGIRIGLLSFCESEFGAVREESDAGFAWVNHYDIDALIPKTRSDCDVLIVQVHAGVEEEDIPLPEWRDRYKRILYLGADAVIGHHPHQPQGWEEIAGKFVIYSLGNFFFQPEYPSIWRKKGALACLEFEGAKLAKVEVRMVDWSTSALSLSSRTDDRVTLANLCRALEEPGYSQAVDKMVERLWRERYSNYYRNAVNGVDGCSGIIRTAKLLVKRLLVPSRLVNDEPLLLHNLSIESHRWLVERALRIRIKA